MKTKVTLSIDSVIVEEAKSKGINISSAAEQGITAFLGRSQHGKVQRGDNGEFVMTEEVRKELESAYTQFERYISQSGAQYDHRKSLIWIFNRAVSVGMDAEELLILFEDRYFQHLKKRAETPKIPVSQEATDKLLDIYFNSFCIVVDNLLSNYHAQTDISNLLIKTTVETDLNRWIMERRKRLGGISRKDLYSILRDRYNVKKGETLL